MNHNRGRNGRMDFGRIRDRSTADTTATNKSFVTGIVVFILMILSAAGPAGIFVLLILGIFAFIMGVMYFVFKSQVVDGTKPAGTVKDIKFDIMRTIREKSEKEGDPMFTEARAHQKRNLTKADYARLDRCSHEECLKSLLEAGIIDRSEYVERIQKLNCSTAH